MAIVNRSEDDVVVDSTLPSNALSSKQFATIVDVLSEGEIEGFPSAAGFTKGTANYNTAALKDVYLGKTPVLRASADPTATQPTDFNFQDVEFEPRFGTSDQTFISGIANIESETNVGSKVENGTPISRQITNSNVNALRVTLRFNSLQKFETNGDVNGTSVDITIKIIQNNGTTSTPISDTVTGRSSSAYNRDYRIDLPSSLNFPITVQVTRVTADAADPTKLRDEFFFQSFTEIIDEQRPYPDIAHAALRFDSQQFSSVPGRMYKVRGVKIKIPHNGTVDATTGRVVYTGTFNGTLTTAKVWCSDPAWILFDLLTNVRYGLGDHITEAQLDKYAFYSASVYCSTLVDDGAGGQEPRFSCNTILQARQDAYEVVNSLTSVMRSISFWTAGSLTISQDRPTDPSYLFNLSNVTSAGFGYSGTSLKTRATVVSVSYFDMENQELDFETVEDASAKAKYGVLHKKITGFGCSSRGQAARLGRFLLFEEQNSTETINFTTGLSEGVVVRPGQVIEVSDPVRAGLRRGGRIKSATTTTVTVDNTDDTDLDATNNPTLSVILSDGSVETKPVSGISGAVITVSSAFSSAPNANSVWILSNTTLETTQWRVVSVTEDKDNYAIIGTAYNSGKFAFIEDGSPLPVRNVTILNALKDAPTIDSAEQFFYVENQKAKVKIILDYEAVPGVSQYRVQYRKDNGNFVSTTVTGTDFTIFDASEGTYEFRVFSLNAALETSAEPSTLTKDFAGKTAIPGDMTGLTAEPISGKLIRLKWNRSTDIDVTHGGLVYIRHDSSGTDGTGTFEKAVDLIEAAPGNSTEAIVPAITGEYILKFQDDGGRFSSGEASVVVNIPEVTDALLVQTRREDLDSPKFQGTKVNTAFDATTNSLNLTGAGQFDSIADFDAEGSLDDIGGISPSGSYDFANTLDLGAVFSLDLVRHFKTEGFYPSDLIDSRTALIDLWTDFDGTDANDVDAQLFVRTTQDDPSGSPTYSDFQNFTSGTFKARGFQFRTVLTSSDPAQDIRVFQLGYSAKFERRVEQSSSVLTSNALTTVPFSAPFFVGTSALGGANSSLPAVNVTAQNLASGDFFEISDVTASNFKIHFKNSSNASISKNFTFTAVGFGKG
nr:phage tail protein [uncultured Mediterranean phage uvMED]BAR22061.1 phage tail protein [uncultured Mediterranean phage uvMED]BAR39049.1 phage tail protein [uncultured Mediterranean phage uvMED]